MNLPTHIDFTRSFRWEIPIPIRYAPGAIAKLSGGAKSSGINSPMIVTDRGSRDLPFIEAIKDQFIADGLPCSIYSDVAPNPRDVDIAAGKQQFAQNDHDGIVAIGGGSGMDAGKAIALVARSNMDLWQFVYGEKPVALDRDKSLVPLICVPTTAGTGAETESTAMITNTERVYKDCVWHPQLKPAWAILDPEISVGLPANLTAWTGCDALVHAIESYCVPYFHPMCEGAALQAMSLIYPALRQAVSDGTHIEARGAMLVGSCLAGISFIKGLGLVHAMSHMVGAEHDTHHGLTNAVLLPVVLRFNRAEIAGKVPAMAQAMGLKDTSFDGFYNAIVNLLDDLEIPRSLGALGATPESVASIAAKAMQDISRKTNPRKSSEAEIQDLLSGAISQVR